MRRSMLHRSGVEVGQVQSSIILKEIFKILPSNFFFFNLWRPYLQFLSRSFFLISKVVGFADMNSQQNGSSAVKVNVNTSVWHRKACNLCDEFSSQSKLAFDCTDLCYKVSLGFSQRHSAKVLRFLSFLVLGLLNENLW